MGKPNEVSERADSCPQDRVNADSCTGAGPVRAAGRRPAGVDCSTCGIHGCSDEPAPGTGSLRGWSLVGASCRTFIVPLTVALLVAVWFRGDEVFQGIAVVGGLGLSMVAMALLAHRTRKTRGESESR